MIIVEGTNIKRIISTTISIRIEGRTDIEAIQKNLTHLLTLNDINVSDVKLDTITKELFSKLLLKLNE